MLCYVGKATKIFFFLIATVALFLGLGLLLLRHGWAHKARPTTCPGGNGGGNGPCSTITSFPDPATAAAVPPPPQESVLVGPATAGAPPFVNPPPPQDSSPVGPATTGQPPPTILNLQPVPPAGVATAPPPLIVAQPGPVNGALSPGQG